MISKLLIANRGEIACRIIKTAKRLNIATVAVYSDIDRFAWHVEMADEAYPLGSAPSIASYLNRDKIINAALQSGAQAIHPGYGFLSEDAEFARQCQGAGLIFVGPSAEAITAMGDKNLAKATMIAAGVPVIPGYHEQDLNLSTLRTAAEQIGLPILVKASAGGGGKGMRLVEKLEHLEEAVTSARREAQASFGDGRVFLEKYLALSRHIEVQILFDQHGKGLYLFDRDCSIQRRHQKIIEEAPAPQLSELTRQQMAETALKAGAAIQYTGVGTIEFLVDEHDHYYFMEMNTRLQVEHPVTEMITGLDLVEWQLRVASGEKLSLPQASVQIKGHALEARLYAENPEQNFMPCAGPLQYYRLPFPQADIRIDTGFRQGDIISVYYDPLIAKLIVWAPDRQAAIEKLQWCLRQTAVAGIHTNLALLNRIVAHPEFLKGKVVTQFITDSQHMLLSESLTPPDIVVAQACLALLLRQQAKIQWLQQQSNDKSSPWLTQDGWRLNDPVLSQIFLWNDNNQWQVRVEFSDNQYTFIWNNQTVKINPAHDPLPKVFLDNQQLTIFYQGEQWQFSLQDPRLSQEHKISGEPLVRAPMPGTLVKLHVELGQQVVTGEKLLVMEAMKMEHTLLAPQNGVIKSILYQPGDRLNEGSELITFE